MTLKPIISIDAKAGISRKYLELYGDHKAKIALDILKSSTQPMPSLPSHPIGECMDIGPNGRIKICTLKEASKNI